MTSRRPVGPMSISTSAMTAWSARDPFAFTPPGYIAPMPYFGSPSRRGYGAPY